MPALDLTLSLPLSMGLYAAAGFVAGTAFFASLHWLAQRLVGARTHAGWLALLHALRFVALAALLVWCARRGAGPLLAAAAGVLVARVLLVGALRREKEPLP